MDTPAIKQTKDRKSDHIELAFQSRPVSADPRFDYEPMTAANTPKPWKPFSFLGKEMKVPMWISGMTGGTDEARKINQNLARVCGEFGMGMSLGSCRILTEDKSRFADFDLRDSIGDAYPFFANLGIAQIEQYVKKNNLQPVIDLVQQLRADGLVVHVNPLQEWLQPEGDRYTEPPAETIEKLLEKVDFKIIVKEVGQGMGPESLKSLLKLPVAIEFGAYGGTNFANVELMRSTEFYNEMYLPIAKIGHTAEEMTEYVNHLKEELKNEIRCNEIIVSGGINHWLDGYYLIERINLPAIYGRASGYLKYAVKSYEKLREYMEAQINGLNMAKSLLRIKKIIDKYDSDERRKPHH